ncbi:MAG: hypothetical protein GY720_16205 [bacterium]|nr:hypothetical protein [bacterium]
MENFVGLAILIAVFVGIAFATRKKPDRRNREELDRLTRLNPNRPPGRGDADVDNWGR